MRSSDLGVFLPISAAATSRQHVRYGHCGKVQTTDCLFCLMVQSEAARQPELEYESGDRSENGVTCFRVSRKYDAVSRVLDGVSIGECVCC